MHLVIVVNIIHSKTVHINKRQIHNNISAKSKQWVKLFDSFRFMRHLHLLSLFKNQGFVGRQKEEGILKRQVFKFFLLLITSSLCYRALFLLLLMFSISTECLSFILTWLEQTGHSGAAASRVQIRRSWWPSSEPLRPAALPFLYTDPTLPTTRRTSGGEKENMMRRGWEMTQDQLPL